MSRTNFASSLKALNSCGIETARGGTWNNVRVARILARIA